MAMAIVIPVSGPVRRRRFETLEEMQAAVGGFIQVISLSESTEAVFNEEGKLENLPANEIATRLCHNLKAIFPDDCIVGTMLIFGRTDADGEFTDAPELPAELRDDLMSSEDMMKRSKKKR